MRHVLDLDISCASPYILSRSANPVPSTNGWMSPYAANKTMLSIIVSFEEVLKSRNRNHIFRLRTEIVAFIGGMIEPAMNEFGGRVVRALTS
jgi:hypothetical protein